MTSGVDQAYANNILNQSGNVSAMPAFSGTLQLKLMSVNGSATSNGTESVWTGYTTGGQTITQSTAAGGTATYPVVTTSWTNASGSTQTIAAIETWDTSPKRYWWGALASSVSLPTLDTIQFAAGACSNSFP
jgi:hypothetical protein